MRGTKAKQIRKFAGDATQKEYVVKHHKAKVLVDAFGNKREVVPVTLFLKNNCGRQVYQLIKRSIGKGTPVPLV